MEPKVIPAERLNAYQRGLLDPAETVTLVQDLLNAGIVWMREGILGELAAAYLAAGLITVPDHVCEDNLFGNPDGIYCTVCDRPIVP